MADDPERDLIPVRDESNYDSRMKAPVSQYPLDEKGHSTLQNHAVSKMERYELEDRFLQIQEENTRLKKQCNEYEDKYKRLATKLMRLANDRKQRLPTAEQRRDLNTEDVINEQNVRIRELEQLNSNLQDRLVVLKQQLASHSRVHNAAHCGPRSVSQSPSRQRGSGLLSNSDLYRGIPSGESGTLPGDNAESRAAQEQEKRLMAEITVLRQQMQGMEQEIQLLREQAARHVAEQEEELVNDAMEEKRQKVAENVEMIRMKRLCKQQAAQLLAQKAHNQALERELTQVKQSLELVQKENDDLHEQLLQERKKVSEHQQEISSLSSYKETVKELTEEIRDSQKEKATLKQHNEQLLALSASVQNAQQTQEKQVMEKVGQLEALLTTERAEKKLATQNLEEQRLLVTLLQKQLLEQENQCQFLENSLKTLTKASESARIMGPPDGTEKKSGQAISSVLTDISSKDGSSLYFSQESTVLTKHSSSTLPEGFILYNCGADSASESCNEFNQQISQSITNKSMNIDLEDTKDECYPVHECDSQHTVSSASAGTSGSLTSNSKSSFIDKLKDHKKRVSLPQVNRLSRSCSSAGSHGVKLEQKQETKSPIHDPGGMSYGTSNKSSDINKAMAVPTSKEDNIQVPSHVQNVMRSSSSQSKKSILKVEKIEKKVEKNEKSAIQEPVEMSKNLPSEDKNQEISLLDATKRPSNHHGSKTKQNQMDGLIHKPVETLNDTVENTYEFVKTTSSRTSVKEAAYHLKMTTGPSSGGRASREKQLQKDIPVREPVEVFGTSQYTGELVRAVVPRANDEDKTQEALHLETARELEKCRELLRVQYNLNSLYKREVESLNRKLREKEEEFEKQLKELKVELKSHSSTIIKLENKYDNDTGKSSRVASISASADKDGNQQDVSVTSGSAKVQSLVLDLHEGLFQLYLENVKFDLEEEKLVNKKFQLQWVFYNHDTSFSPWFSGEKSNLEHSTLYKVDISSDFLEYLFSDQCVVNLYMESPEQTEIIATGKFHFSGVLDSPYEKWKLSVPLQLVSNMEESIGVLYCWYQIVCSHKPIKSFIESYCSLKKKVYSSESAAGAYSGVLHKKSEFSFPRKNSGDVSCKDSSLKYLTNDESSSSPEGQEVESILPQGSSSSEDQSNQQHQSTPLEEFKPFMSEQAEEVSLPQQEENLVKSLEQPSSMAKTDAVQSGSDIKLVTSSYGRVLSNKSALPSHTGSIPFSHKTSCQTGSIVTFRESSRLERSSGIASPISEQTIESSLRKLVTSTSTGDENQSTLPEQENGCPAVPRKSSSIILRDKLTGKSSMMCLSEKKLISSNSTQNNANSEEKETEGSVISLSVKYGKQFSSEFITPLTRETKTSAEEIGNTPSDSPAKGMPDPTTDSNSEGDSSSVFEESNWRNYSLRSLQIQKETEGERENSPPVVEEQQNQCVNWASDESSSISTVEDLRKPDSVKVTEVPKDVQISSSSTSDVEQDLDDTERDSRELKLVHAASDLPLKWEENIKSYISQDSTKHVELQSDKTDGHVASSHDEDDKDVVAQVRVKPSDNFSTVTEPGSSSKVRRRIPQIYQDPEVSRYQDLNDLMMQKQAVKKRRICCFNISSSQSTIPDSIEIVIHSLTLAHNTYFMRSSDITQLYVEYSFLGYDGEEMETMSASVNNDLHMNFNYRRTFYVDYGMHFKQRTILSNILTAEDKSRRNLRFTVVSEPPEEQDHIKECEEIGYADVDLVQLMTEGRDLIKENIPVRTVDGAERLGFLTISITGVKLMHKVAFETK